jgi:hypothetical protein
MANGVKAMIPNDFIQALLSRVDIVEVIDPHLPLKKAGANYVACCPFHNEKSPSFTVSPSKQFYHCFGCGCARYCDWLPDRIQRDVVSRRPSPTWRAASAWTFLASRRQARRRDARKPRTCPG